MSDFVLGEHANAIGRIEKDVTELRADVREIRDLLAEQRGEKRAKTVAFGMVGGGAFTLLLKLLAVRIGLHV